MGKTKRRLPYSYLRKMKGRMSAIKKGCRKGSIPPDPHNDKPYSREAKAPWVMAWKMVRCGHDRNEIAKQLLKTYGVPIPRGLKVGRIVEERRGRLKNEREGWRISKLFSVRLPNICLSRAVKSRKIREKE